MPYFGEHLQEHPMFKPARTFQFWGEDEGVEAGFVDEDGLLFSTERIDDSVFTESSLSTCSVIAFLVFDTLDYLPFEEFSPKSSFLKMKIKQLTIWLSDYTLPFWLWILSVLNKLTSYKNVTHTHDYNSASITKGKSIQHAIILRVTKINSR